MAKKTDLKNANTILCKDCENHYDPDWTNLGADSQLPILCRCKVRKFKVFYNLPEIKCTEPKPIKR